MFRLPVSAGSRNVLSDVHRGKSKPPNLHNLLKDGIRFIAVCYVRYAFIGCGKPIVWNMLYVLATIVQDYDSSALEITENINTFF